jgi:multidrug efflux pump subunit AcrA (membrane-fusion protein)
MAMKAAVLMLAMGCGLAASAQDATDQSQMKAKIADDQASIAAKVRAAQADAAIQQSLAKARLAELAPEIAAAQSLMNARLAPEMAAQQSLLTAKLAALAPEMAAKQSALAARLATLEPRLAAQQAVLMARLEPLRVLGIQMQAAGNFVRVGQAKDELFAGTEKFETGASNVTEVNLDPSTMGLVGGRARDGDLAKKMRSMVIHTYEYPKEGMYNPADVDVYRKKLEDGSWSCSVHVKDKDGTTDICSRTSADHESSEMVIIAAERRELTFIHMSGNMSLEDLEKMNSGPGRRALPTPPMPPMPATPPTPPTPATPSSGTSH